MNNKGWLVLPLIFQIAFGGVAAACIWHIPAWSKAKREGKTAEYQAQKMWPQSKNKELPYTAVGNGGEFKNGYMK